MTAALCIIKRRHSITKDAPALTWCGATYPSEEPGAFTDTEQALLSIEEDLPYRPCAECLKAIRVVVVSELDRPQRLAAKKRQARPAMRDD